MIYTLLKLVFVQLALINSRLLNPIGLFIIWVNPKYWVRVNFNSPCGVLTMMKNVTIQNFHK